MIILLQSVTIQFHRLFLHISYYKVRQSASSITKCDRLYYKVHQVLQSATVITKWDVTKDVICVVFCVSGAILVMLSIWVLSVKECPCVCLILYESPINSMMLWSIKSVSIDFSFSVNQSSLLTSSVLSKWATDSVNRYFLFALWLDMNDTLNYFINHNSSCSNNLLHWNRLKLIDFWY